MPSQRQRNLLLIGQRKLQLKWSFKWKFTGMAYKELKKFLRKSVWKVLHD